MKKLTIIPLILSILMLFVSVYGDSDISVAAPSAILIDAESGRVLYEKDADEKRYPASTTKIMTGILAVEYGKFDEIVTIGENPPLVKIGSSQIYLVPGEQLTMDQLLYALMVESANDAAVAIAEQISGSVDEFVKLMNEKAKKIGANNTHFVNPNGLHDDNHYTTARDLSLMAKYAMTLPKFREVVKTLNYTIPKTNKQDERNYITNTNKLLWKINDKYRYEYATGIKTGYTTEAKSCLVGGAKKDDIELISVVMATDSSGIYTDTKSLFEYGFANYNKVGLLKRDQIATTISVEGSEEKLNLVAAEDFAMLLNDSEKSRLSTDIKVNDTIQLPIEKGETLAEMYFYLDGTEVKKVNLLAQVGLEAPNKKSLWWLWAILAFLLYRTVVTIYKVRKRRKSARTVTYIRR